MNPNHEEIKRFFQFIYERQLIYWRKEILKLSSPWTSDEVLQKYKFCNIYRFLDKGTQYIYNRVINNESLSLETKLFNIIVYRIFNKTNLFDGEIWNNVLDPSSFDIEKERHQLKQIATKRTLFHNAYLIRSVTLDKNDPEDKKYVHVLKMLYFFAKEISLLLKNLQNPTSPEDSLNLFKYSPLIGPFISGQMFLDCCYNKEITPYTNNDWVVLGPGSSLGLKYLDLPIKNESVKYLCSIQKDFLKEEWEQIAYKDHYYPNISLMDMQNSLCEYSKYYKFKTGLGRKRLYKPVEKK